MAPQIFFRTKEQHAAVTERLQIMKDDFAECEYSAEALEGNGKKMMKPIEAGLVDYCSVECQKYDWQFHKRTCKPCVAAAMPASLSAGLASGRF